MPSIGSSRARSSIRGSGGPRATAAYLELRDDDAFWAARRVASFTDEMIRAVVHTGQFSDQDAEKYLADVLIQRRETIKRIYLTNVNPIVNPHLDAKGLEFENAAVDGGVAKGPVTYRATWMTFDNATGAVRQISETRSATTTLTPPALPSSGFLAIDIAADSGTYPTWKQPVRAYLRQQAGQWKLVGLDRLPEHQSAGR